MSEHYTRPRLVPLDHPHSDAVLARAEAYLTLSRKDVLGIVQSAFNELGPNDPALVAVKRQVLDEVAEGRLGHALRTAIIGAGGRGRA